MRNRAILTLIFFIAYVFAPLGNMLDLKKVYTFESEEKWQIIKLDPVYAQESSNINLPLKIISYKANLSSNFSKPKDTFIFKIKKTPWIVDKDLSISLFDWNKKIQIQIDNDWDERTLNDKYFYTEPVFLNSKTNLKYEINSSKNITETGLSVIWVDTKNYNEKLEFSSWNNVNALDSNIISRAQWWADESLRYKDSPFWASYFAKEAQNTTPKSAATLKAEQRINDINNYLSTNFSDQNNLVEYTKQENWHDLVWPIAKTKRVEKIVIHHTAWEYKDEQDDASIVRWIYYYHAITRGWWDIWYNYLVWRDWKVYEWRAWWDYVVWAHALWNNNSTVGVSVMGNFMTQTLSSAQRAWIDYVLEYLETKYWININKTSIWHKECSDSSCLLKDFSVSNLVWHRDVWYTSCPWDNLYPILSEIRLNEEQYWARNLTYINNPNINTIHLASANTVITSTDRNLSKWPTIKVRLSYSWSTAIIKSLSWEKMKITLWDKSWYIAWPLTFETKWNNLMRLLFNWKKYAFDKITLSAPVLEIPSWSRIPAWDTNKIYNDNKFRNSITIYNDGWKLTLVNELPVEDYLRWLAEISNNDNVEKIKTILVAARSYAMWYTDPLNRKFPWKYYDWSDNPDEFQKYLGYEYEKRDPNIWNLVDETNNIVIKYDWKLIKPWYFNQSDWQTKSYKQYCEDRKKFSTFPSTMECVDVPYLQSVSDPAWALWIRWHWVGISWAWATYLATQSWYTYDQIIKYFLAWVTVEKADNINVALK